MNREDPAERAASARVLAALDATSLDADDTPADIRALCRKAASLAVRPAAVCIFPVHIETARRALESASAAGIAVAAVVNFPGGGNDPARTLAETRRAIASGADEIDVVFAWRAYLAGDRESGPSTLRQCKDACGPRLMKAIIESGELGDASLVRELAGAVLDAGADFVKTSTGKTGRGATPEAAQAILECLRERGSGGIKVSGGIRTLAQARGYLELAERICGKSFATPRRFRIGSSSILDEACAETRNPGR
jgi:deoxyribose-phosphate aldolase